MKIERAQEIFDSKGVIDVNYNGNPIWIKSVNQEEQTAEIEMLDAPTNNEVVSVRELNEMNI
ncbi:hypothetical protein SH1V18_12600 [Vallitalea longa]|uniref:SASP H n=1 Tax=Vallitalea longa TaxID=2936439 RepID=A0A9W5Y7Z6_9FIRM|nr:H-type small acid-soluble spore protein [Vallitalea longa]GKX28780.1 hypothetical protein SH1V18_12600 [Vallitalea longa]